MLVSPRPMHSRRNYHRLSLSSDHSVGSSSSSLLSPRLPEKSPRPFTSPPLSPSLPSLIPRHGKKPGRSEKVVTGLSRTATILACAGLAVIGYLGLCHLHVSRPTSSIYPAYSQSSDSDWSGKDGVQLGLEMPSTPGVLMVTDKRGRTRYTMVIPATAPFPLHPAEYRGLCNSAHETSEDLGKGGKSGSKAAGLFPLLGKRHRHYSTPDPWYLDVAEAEKEGWLPKGTEQEISYVKGGKVDKNMAGKKGGDGVCEKSLTYVLETDDAGMGNSLMQAWMAYGIAQEEGRAFFLDDSKWPYGDYTTYFEAPPLPNCRPPPRTHAVPCPHNAKHLIMSAATTYYSLGHQFSEAHEDPRAMGVLRQVNIFGLARTGYEALFKIQGEDGEWLGQRLKELYGEVNLPGTRPSKEEEGNDGNQNSATKTFQNRDPVVGMHVRRGDVHPFSFEYGSDYIPVDRYVDTAWDLASSLANKTEKPHNSKAHPHASPSPHPHATLLLASDDPDLYAEPEVADVAEVAQSRIALASKRTLEAAAKEQGIEAQNKYLDEVNGWEGGFYKSMFWSLGNGDGQRPDAFSDPPKVDDATMLLRGLIGRAYLLDLAVMGQADGVVCATSATGCRILAVMMGWDKAIVEKQWRNVDALDWRGVIW